MTSSKILFFLCLFFISGIFIESIFNIPQIFIWGFLFILLIFILYTLSTRSRLQGIYFIFSFCFLFFVLGVLRFQISELNIKNDKLSKLNDTDSIVTLYGKVADEPVKKDTTQNIKINVKNILISGQKEKVLGKILITVPKYPEFNYQDILQIEGKLKTPFENEEFSYKNYLLKDGIYSVMSFPKIKLTEKYAPNFFKDPVPFIYNSILQVKEKLRQSTRQNYVPPESFILEGTILGDSSALTNDLKNKLNIVGLRHIIAVSGTHVIILSSILMSILLFLGFYRGQAFYFSVFFIWLYIILTGLPASGVRAGVMATIMLLAQKLGRQSHTERMIVVSAAIMLFLNPLLLIYDVGFELSFLAVLGLIYLSPTIKEFLKQVIEKGRKLLSLKFQKFAISELNKKNKDNQKLNDFLQIFSATLSAQIFTLPVMLYNFGNVSLIAPITNILVLPIVEPLMIFGFLSVFLGIFSNVLALIFYLPCYFLLIYFLKIIDIFSKSWAIKIFENVHWIWPTILYVLLAFLVALIKKKNRPKFLK